jgi:hypothetical protein
MVGVHACHHRIEVEGQRLRARLCTERVAGATALCAGHGCMNMLVHMCNMSEQQVVLKARGCCVTHRPP